MSAPPSPVEADRVPRQAFWATALVVGLVVAVSIVVAGKLLRAWSRPEVVMTGPARAQIGIVEQTLLQTSSRGLDEERAKRDALAHFGWSDRAHGIARVPIDRAMDLAADPAFVRRAFPGGT